MNLSAAIMLVDKTVRPLKVEYDPENTKNNNPMKWFKTINPDIQKGDLVIVQTTTRHGFTVAKVTEIDFAVDFNSAEPWGWVADKVDHEGFKRTISVEEGVKDRVAKAEENRMREQLKRDMGLANVDFSDLLIGHGAATTPGALSDETKAGSTDAL